MLKKIEFISITWIITAVSLLLISCPTPLSKSMTNEVLDSVAPVITVLTPDDGDSYGAYTLITGSVGDEADNSTEGKVVSLFVEILGVTGDQGVTISDDGTFSVTLETNGAGYSSDIVVKLTATDWNGNSTETTMALRKADGEITGFTVTAGNRNAEITWDSLPKAENYTLQEFRSGESVEGITETSYTWEDLSNGNKCSFRVEADIDGLTYCSEIKEAIPLAKSTLVPNVESVYRGIRISWKDIPAASEYVIERSEFMEGPYAIRTITPDATFLDKDLERGAGYYYRIYPVERMDNPDIAISSSRYACAGYFHGRNDYSIFSSVDTDNSAFETVIRGDYAYIADGTDGLWIADISDIYNPVLVSNCDTPTVVNPVDSTDLNYGNAQGLALSDNYAYIANRETGMNIIDISNPLSPFLLDVSYDSDGGTADDNSCKGVALSSDYTHAFLADGSSGLRYLDISGSAQPESRGFYDTSGTAKKLVVDSSYAYIADEDDGLQIINIEDPANLSVEGYYTKVDAMGIVLAEISSVMYAFIADNDSSLEIVDVSDPSSVDDTSTTWNCPTSGSALGVTVSGTRAYVACRINGLNIIDVSDPTAPAITGLCDTPGDAHGVTINGDYAFVSDFNSGLQIVDISFPSASLVSGGSYDTPGTALGTEVSGNYVFIADSSGGINMIDVSNPSNPLSTDSLYDTDSDIRGVSVSGNYAYIVDYDKGLQVIDISDPSNLVLKATCDIKASTPGQSRGIMVSGSYAYVAEEKNGLQIVDISDPDNPFLAGLCDMDTYALGIAVSGNYAYVAGNDGGLIIMNISDPDHPYQVGSYNTAGNAYGIAVSGNYVYIADGSNGLVILDVSTPESITDSSTAYTLDTDDIATGVTVSGSYAFVADGSDGLRVIDISDPANPLEVTFCDTDDAVGVAVAGRYAYVADSTEGLKVIDLWEEN